MVDSRGSSAGVPPFHVHPGHAFEGFELTESPRGRPLLVARCDCGEVLDVADACFTACPECVDSGGGNCERCGSTGRVVDHAALEWRVPTRGPPVVSGQRDETVRRSRGLPGAAE